MKKTLLIAALTLSTLNYKAQITEPDLPQTLCDVLITLPDTTGYTRVTVGKSGGYDYTNLQQAINDAMPGTILLLAPDTFTVPLPFTVNSYFMKYKVNPNNKWIIIMPLYYNLLPPSGIRIDPNASTGDPTYPLVRDAMPKFPTLAPYTNNPCITFERMASYYMLIGLDIFTNPKANILTGVLLEMGDGFGTDCGGQTTDWGLWNSNNMDSIFEVPHHIMIDRCYIHADKNADGSKAELYRAVSLNTGYTSIVNCKISDIVNSGFEAAAVSGWGGTGHYRIINNYFESSGINVLFGGNPSRIPAVVSDMEFSKNHCFKQRKWEQGSAGWDGSTYCIKNNFELKIFQRALVEDNIFENCWEAYCEGQTGFGVLFTNRSSQSEQGYDDLNDITCRYNLIKNTEQGISVLGKDYLDTTSAPQSHRFMIHDNLILIDTSSYNNYGVFYNGNIQDLIIDHNTAINTNDRPLNIDGYPTAVGTNLNCSFTNNIFYHGYTGIVGYGGTYQWESVITNGWPDVTDANQRFNKNVMARTSATANNSLLQSFCYPTMYSAGISKNYWPRYDSIMFVDSANGRNNVLGFKLASNSPFKNMGSDGKDIGADIQKVYDGITMPYVDACIPLSVSEKNNKQDNISVIVSPNPSHGIFSVYSEQENLTYIVMNAIGEVVKTGVMLNNKVDISNYSRGVYFVKFIDTNKSVVAVKKVVYN